MSDELQDKLKSHQDTKAVKDFLAQMNNLEDVSYISLKKDFSVVEKILAEIREISSAPNNTIEINSDSDLLEDWIKSVLSQSKIQNFIYLRMSDFYGAGWIQVKSSNIEKSLLSIWQNLSVKNVEIVNKNISTVLVFSEEEYKIEAFWQDID